MRDVKEGVEIAIYVQPGARATEVSGEHDGALKLRIHAPPVDGKANAAVVAFLALKLDVARARIALISGDKDLITLLSSGFLLLVFVQVGIGILRG